MGRPDRHELFCGCDEMRRALLVNTQVGHQSRNLYETILRGVIAEYDRTAERMHVQKSVEPVELILCEIVTTGIRGMGAHRGVCWLFDPER